MFEIVDGRQMDDGRTPEHGYTISSPCEPEGSGELKTKEVLNFTENVPFMQFQKSEFSPNFHHFYKTFHDFIHT